ncbi:hypothetical protein K1514_15625 [Paraclostridium bifermentans]|uniref:hypothetical protein n=1 Tax=Paraclostridium TaxID=1849822 RepID=UPI001CC5C8CC|nr:MULTISPECIES: hypothetical protein [Paraclostridium]MBZ6007322.1 hypothetical protein [Paraclostridium bifermentans]MDU0297454.1 hypothetical protein [Paraclostridium sp. MRS3W1]
MKYYAERKNLLDSNLEITFDKLKDLFLYVYRFFKNKNGFDVAENGVWRKGDHPWEDDYQLVSPLFGSSAEIFFMNHLNSEDIYPIYEHYEDYSEEELFTVIEILYDKIAVYNNEKGCLDVEDIRKEFAIEINNILKFYDGGYFLETNSGTIIKGSDEPLINMLTEDLVNYLNEDVMTKMRTAVKLYYRFDSNMETKKKAINILADILEPLRNELKDILNKKYEVNKNNHDKLIFEIVNGFNIRHNDKKQRTDYEKEIWYDWMMQYYCSIIITFYKLKSANE